MTCPHCVAAGEFFGERQATRDLARFRRRGAAASTRRLLEALGREDVEGLRVLDIGAGVGAVHLALLEGGAHHATHVDASVAYQTVAAQEAERRGLKERIDYIAGDYLDVAQRVPAADIVCLDRVVCCYPDAEALVSHSASAARRLYGVVFPVDRRWVGWLIRLANLWMAVTRNAFRAYAHSESRIRSAAENTGLREVHGSRSGMWRILVFRRDTT